MSHYRTFELEAATTTSERNKVRLLVEGQWQDGEKDEFELNFDTPMANSLLLMLSVEGQLSGPGGRHAPTKKVFPEWKDKTVLWLCPKCEYERHIKP